MTKRAKVCEVGEAMKRGGRDCPQDAACATCATVRAAEQIGIVPATRGRRVVLVVVLEVEKAGPLDGRAVLQAHRAAEDAAAKAIKEHDPRAGRIESCGGEARDGEDAPEKRHTFSQRRTLARPLDAWESPYHKPTGAHPGTCRGCNADPATHGKPLEV